MDHLQAYSESVEGLRGVGNQFWTRGWSLGTSSNYSVVVNQNPKQLLVTASGKDKGHLGKEDFVLIDEQGRPSFPNQLKSSAETLLHCHAVSKSGAGAVLHTHSVWSTILSQHYFAIGGIRLEGYEMLKGIDGVATHESSLWLPIFDNTQDIPSLVKQVGEYQERHANEKFFGYLIRRHGMYTWGRDLAEATRHVEIIEFLLECVGRQTRLV